jgi:hypothetical protein
MRQIVKSLGVMALAAAVGGAGCSRTEQGPATATPAGQGGGTASASAPQGDYPEPRFPSYLKPPASMEEVMPYVRPLAKARHGLQGAGLGIIEKGESVLFVVSVDAEEMIVNAVVKAMEERGVTPVVKRDYELVGIPRDEAVAYRKARRSYTSEAGYMEAANWVDANFPDPAAAKEWLKQRRPDLHAKLFPASREMTPRHARRVRRPRDPRVSREEPQAAGRVLGQGGQHEPPPLHATGRSEVPRPVPGRQPLGRHGPDGHLPG